MVVTADKLKKHQQTFLSSIDLSLGWIILSSHKNKKADYFADTVKICLI